MIRARNSARPAVEALDSLLLLSTIAAHPAAMVHEAKALSLSGEIQGRGTLTNASLTVVGTGRLGAVGAAAIHTNISLTAPSDVLVLSTRKGKIDIIATSPFKLGSTITESTYSITGGTGAYRGATGSGNLTVFVTPRHSHGLVANISFS